MKTQKDKKVSLRIVLCVAWLCAATALSRAERPSRAAEDILKTAGVDGGLVVHIGCESGELLAALSVGGRFVVHGLDRDQARVNEVRQYLLSRDLYGPVAVQCWSGEKLPYIDNLVNLVVAESRPPVARKEIMRVLRPSGVACIKRAGKWRKIEKTRPDETDDWTHYLHGPDGNPVSHDTVVAPPRRLQWVGGPKWLRNHEFMSSLNGLVSSRGRIFYIIDEGLRNHIYLPSHWSLVARDGYNGKILWKRSIDKWWTHIWPMKSGPAYLPRRLVAVDDRVYATLGIDAPLSALDAATGETIRTYDGTKATEEIVFSDGTLFLVIDTRRQMAEYRQKEKKWGRALRRANPLRAWKQDWNTRSIRAVSAASGELLWAADCNVAPLTLAASEDNVFYHDGSHVVCLDRHTGRKKWTSGAVGPRDILDTGYAPRLVVYEDMVIFSQGKHLWGLSAEDGEVLWDDDQFGSGHHSPSDVFVIDGLVWTSKTGDKRVPRAPVRARDFRTGKVRTEFKARHYPVFFMHQRCYPGKATKRYLLTSRTGTEFLDLETERSHLHHWARGSCIYGIMPANGLMYKPPDSCACYYQSKLHHFSALAPAGKAKGGLPETDEPRLKHGPAYGKSVEGQADRSDWPAYRHDTERSGHSNTEVSLPLGRAWEAEIGGKLTSITVASGRVFAAAVNRHVLYALEADSGRVSWKYSASGRIDSPPTIHRGRVVFGSADGRVYCLRAADGRLIWRYRAAPASRKLLSYQQLESLWPVHGSVLVRDGVAYCLAGRNMFVDGGMRLLRLDVRTGKKLSETVLDDSDPRTGKNLQALMGRKAMPVAGPDILSTDGNFLYMKAQRFNLQGKRIGVAVEVNKEKQQQGEGRHLFCPTGFLDDAWFHRSYWIYGKNAGEGHGEYRMPARTTPCGRILVFDKECVYGLSADEYSFEMAPRSSHYLFAADRNGEGVNYHWKLDSSPVLANAMVLADRTLFLAGPPDLVDEEEVFGAPYGTGTKLDRRLRAQEKAWLDKRGALLWAVSADSGKKLADYRLGSVPVWDGMAAAGGRLYISTKDGRVVCLGK